MRNIKCIVAYDGTDFRGYQRQGRLRTVQAELEAAAAIILRETAKIAASGRTDAGVHARGQVINFLTGCSIPVARIPHAFNSALPPDIVLLGAEEVPADFHARIRAKRKTYCYQFYRGPFPSPFYRHYAYHVPEALDWAAMETAAQHLIGQHDFTSFRASGSTVRSNVRTVFAAGLTPAGETVDFRIAADGFLYNMVRIIVGTLLEIGRGKLEPETMAAIITARDRAAAGPTAPPHGLYLERVEY